ncbi:MAG: hypothetical protein AAFY15_04700 [Cyanobacteria bacterium J06648_11]
MRLDGELNFSDVLRRIAFAVVSEVEVAREADNPMTLAIELLLQYRMLGVTTTRGYRLPIDRRLVNGG